MSMFMQVIAKKKRTKCSNFESFHNIPAEVAKELILEGLAYVAARLKIASWHGFVGPGNPQSLKIGRFLATFTIVLIKM